MGAKTLKAIAEREKKLTPRKTTTTRKTTKKTEEKAEA